MNDSTSYKLGELDQGFKDIVARLERLESKVDSLNTWRWKTVGAVSVVAVLSNVAINYLI